MLAFPESLSGYSVGQHSSLGEARTDKMNNTDRSMRKIQPWKIGPFFSTMIHKTIRPTISISQIIWKMDMGYINNSDRIDGKYWATDND